MKSQLKHLSFRMFFALDRLGIHVLPKHFYTPIPDYAWLKANPEAWMGRTSMKGVKWDLDEQLSWLEEVCRRYYHEVENLESFQTAQSFGPGFGAIESQILHCVVRKLKPNRIVEVGSGASTVTMLRAVSLNHREGLPNTNITCIEPFPKPQFREIEGVTHIEEMVQKVPISAFDSLESGDILFIDSSHAVKVGSDVNRLLLDVIPNLSKGVYIHIHDVYLPYTYPRTALSSYLGWQETSLLLALLKGNDQLSVLACLSALHYDRPQQLSQILSDYVPQPSNEGLPANPANGGHFPASFWMQTG